MNHKKGKLLRFVPNKYPLPGQVHDLHKTIAKDALLEIYVNSDKSSENKANIWIGLHVDTKFLHFK